MGKKSTRENKNIYQIYREDQNLTRDEASEMMTGVSSARIQKIEYETLQPTPFDVVEMSKAYKRPDLCNYYCSNICEIGDNYIPEIELKDLANTVLETVASLNDMHPHTNRLIQIARDGKITEEELPEFAYISNKLEEISLAIDSLDLWIKKTASENNLNMEQLLKEKEKQRNK